MDLRERAALVGALSTAISNGDIALDVIPNMLAKLITEDKWLHFITRFDEEVIYQHTHEDFVKFVTSRPLQGLGTTLEQLEQFIQHDTTAHEAFIQLARVPLGTNQYTAGFDIIKTRKPPTGTSKAYALQKLSDEGQINLLEQVKAGKLSAHEAMKKAGFRRPRVAIALDDPASAAKTLLTHASPEFLDELRTLLNKGH